MVAATEADSMAVAMREGEMKTEATTEYRPRLRHRRRTKSATTTPPQRARRGESAKPSKNPYAVRFEPEALVSGDESSLSIALEGPFLQQKTSRRLCCEVSYSLELKNACCASRAFFRCPRIFKMARQN